VRQTVSVVIPTYNCGHLIGDAINSVLRQTVTVLEVIVVDDGSTDDTSERLEAFAERVRLVRQTNQGVAAARNRGVAEAQGEFVAFLDADDGWHPEKLSRQLSAFDAAPQLGLLGTDAFAWPAGDLPELPPIGKLEMVAVTWEQLVVKNRFVTSSILARRANLHRAGTFDTRLQGPEDHDLWIRFAAMFPVANLRAPLTGYRDTTNSLSKHARRMEEGMRLILTKLRTMGSLDGRPLLRRKAYSILSHRCSFMYSEAGHHAAAFWRSLKALAIYPLPYPRDEVASPCERLKRLTRVGVRAFARN